MITSSHVANACPRQLVENGTRTDRKEQELSQVLQRVLQRRSANLYIMVTYIQDISTVSSCWQMLLSGTGREVVVIGVPGINIEQLEETKWLPTGFRSTPAHKGYRDGMNSPFSDRTPFCSSHFTNIISWIAPIFSRRQLRLIAKRNCGWLRGSHFFEDRAPGPSGHRIKTVKYETANVRVKAADWLYADSSPIAAHLGPENDPSVRNRRTRWRGLVITPAS